MRLSMLCAAIVWAWATVQPGAVSMPHPGAIESMPAAQQNAIVQKYCAGCHKGAMPGGGLSLEDFDATRQDPGLALLIVAKISKDGAMSAAGIPRPDAPTLDAFLAALSGIAERPTTGVGVWDVTLAPEPKSGYTLVTARIQQEVTTAARRTAVYELTLTCSGKTHRGDMRLATSTRAGSAPAAPRALSPHSSGDVTFRYAIDGGAARAATLQIVEPHSGSPTEPLTVPTKTLGISDLFANERVSFDFTRLTPSVRQQLATCVTPSQ